MTLPVVKCAGGKRKLLPFLLPHVPKKIEMYAEPFVGGGALYFEIWKRCKAAILIDQNKDLVVFYRTLRDDPKGLIAQTRAIVVSEDTFYRVRAIDPRGLSDVHRAARFLYLNKTCFNGLWRVNRKGKFNVPWGKKPDGATVVFEEELLEASKALQRARIIHSDFTSCARYEPDFVYCDPPYDPVSDSSDFTRYAKNDFTWKDQKRLATWAAQGVKSTGAKFMLSNADTKRVRKLYAEWSIQDVLAARAINSDVKKRGKVKELIIT